MPLEQKATHIHLQYQMFLFQTAQKSKKMRNPLNNTPDNKSTVNSFDISQIPLFLFLNHPEHFSAGKI